MHNNLIKYLLHELNPIDGYKAYVKVDIGGKRSTYRFITINKTKIMEFGLYKNKKHIGGFELVPIPTSFSSPSLHSIPKLKVGAIPIFDYNLQICGNNAEVFKHGYKIRSFTINKIDILSVIYNLLQNYRFVNIRFGNILATRRRLNHTLSFIFEFVLSILNTFPYYDILSTSSSVTQMLCDQIDLCIFKYSDFFVTYVNEAIYCLLISFSNSAFNKEQLFMEAKNGWLMIFSDKADDIVSIDGDKNMIHTDMTLLETLLEEISISTKAVF